jgi:nucleoside-diphosphate-sugar epimerase
LGRDIAEKLIERGDLVRGLARRRDATLEALGVEWHVGDVRDPGAVRRACQGQEIVFHTAAVAGIWGPWHEYYQVNTQGTQHVIAGCRNAQVPRLVFTSSPSVTFDGGEQCGVDETVGYARRWLCHYPHSKALAEQAVLAANDHDGLSTCALRPHLIWGPRDPHLVPRLLARARAGQLRQVGDGTNRIDMVYVENAADAHLAAADAMARGSPVGGRAYFISQGEPVNCWQWINALLKLAGLPPVTKRIGVIAAWRMGALLEAAYRLLALRGEPPMTRFLAAQLGRSHYFDITRARNDFGYQPRISTAEGMQRLANSWTNG